MANNYEVKFVDTSHEVKVTMEKLSKSALRAAGKVVSKALKENTRSRTKHLQNHIAFWARINRSTGQPELQVGYYSWQKVKARGKIPSNASPFWFEFGVKSHIINVNNARTLTDGKIDFGKSVTHPGLREEHILRNSVFDNIEEIRKAQEEYLALLNKTMEEAKAMIEESEEPVDA